MAQRIAWPPEYAWLHDYALAKPDAVLEYKASWEAMLYRVHGRIFALFLRNKANGRLVNLKCDPYLSLDYRSRHQSVLPGWHMNKLHWISLWLGAGPPEDLCRELLDLSYDLVVEGLPRRIRVTRLLRDDVK